MSIKIKSNRMVVPNDREGIAFQKLAEDDESEGESGELR
jgi:hypothetical protein